MAATFTTAKKPVIPPKKQASHSGEHMGKFFKLASQRFEQYYGNWRTPKLINDTQTGISRWRTIFIPEYFSCIRDNLGPQDRNPDPGRYVGDEAEKTVFYAMKQIACGGIVVCGMASGSGAKWDPLKLMPNCIQVAYEKLIYRENDRRHEINQKYFGAAEQSILSPGFECDILIFHHLIGIYCIEVKGSHNFLAENVDDNELYVKARQQIKDLKIKFQFLATAIFNLRPSQTNEMEPNIIGIPFTAAICFPNCKLPPVPGDENYDHIDCEFFNNDLQKFKEFWAMKNWKCNEQNWFKNRKYCRFIETMLASRSLKPELMHGITNALYVAQKIFKQQIYPLEMQKKIQKAMLAPITKGKTAGKPHTKESQLQKELKIGRLLMDAESIFLTAEQLAVAECEDKVQILTGPPGTGKTLLLLYSALREASQNACGKVYFSSTETQIALLRQMCSAYQLERNLVFVPQSNRFIVAHSNDSVFFDEDNLNAVALVGIGTSRFLTSRLLHSGKTMCAVTGGIYAFPFAANNNYEEQFDALELKGCKIHRLKAVMRGSTDIISHWLKLNSSLTDVHAGHSIECAPVTIVSDVSIDCVLSSIIETLNKIRRNHYCRLKDIAVLTIGDTKRIRRFLKNNAILLKDFHNVCFGSIQDQISGDDAIAVCDVTHAMSHEWPFVIFCSLSMTTNTNDWAMIMACSRAIAELHILQYDFWTIHDYISDLYNRTVTANAICVNFLDDSWINNAYYLAVRECKAISLLHETSMGSEKKLKASVHSTIEEHKLHMILCKNHLSERLVLFPSYDPQIINFTECLTAIAEDTEALRWYVEKSFKEDRWSLLLLKDVNFEYIKQQPPHWFLRTVGPKNACIILNFLSSFQATLSEIQPTKFKDDLPKGEADVLCKLIHKIVHYLALYFNRIK